VIKLINICGILEMLKYALFWVNKIFRVSIRKQNTMHKSKSKN